MKFNKTPLFLIIPIFLIGCTTSSQSSISTNNVISQNVASKNTTTEAKISYNNIIDTTNFNTAYKSCVKYFFDYEQSQLYSTGDTYKNYYSYHVDRLDDTQEDIFLLKDTNTSNTIGTIVIDIINKNKIDIYYYSIRNPSQWNLLQYDCTNNKVSERVGVEPIQITPRIPKLSNSIFDSELKENLSSNTINFKWKDGSPDKYTLYNCKFTLTNTNNCIINCLICENYKLNKLQKTVISDKYTFNKSPDSLRYIIPNEICETNNTAKILKEEIVKRCNNEV